MKPSALMALTIGTFAIGTDLYLVSGILPSLASGLGTTAANTGQLVGIFALTYAFFAPILGTLTGGMARRPLLVFSLGSFALTNALCALAPDFWFLIVGRVGCALAACLFIPNASALVAAVEVPERRGASLGLVMAGLNLATIVGVPLGIAVNLALGWRASFGFIALLAAFAAVWVNGGVPEAPRGPKTKLVQRMALLADPSLLRILGTTLLSLAGAFTVYTYLAVFLREGTGLGAGEFALLVAGYGTLGIGGAWVGGRCADAWGPRKTMVAILVLLVVIFSGMGLWPRSLPLMVGLMLGWGFVGAAFTPVQQLRVVRTAPGATTGALALHSSAIYLGQALAAETGAWVVSVPGPLFLGWAAVPFLLIALSLVLFPYRRARA